MIKVSIVVPVFNTFNYLEKCVYSLVNQTLPEIEIILVDDGSTDSSSLLCDSIAQKYNSVKVIHKSNGGLSSARNEGIKAAKGSFIGFVDSDDFVDKDMFEKMYNILISKNSKNIACVNFRKVYSNGKIEEKHSLFNTLVEQRKEDYFKDLLLHKGDVSVCTKLFPKELIGRRFFEEGRLNEDLLYIFSLDFENIIFIGETKYNYFVRDNSITNSFSKAFTSMGENSISIKEKAVKEFPALLEPAERFAIVQNLFLILKFPRKGRSKSPTYINAVNYVLKNYKDAMANVFITKKEKIYLKAFKYFRNIFLFIYHWFR